MTAEGHLLEQCLLFGRYLRFLGIPVSPHQITTWAESFAHLDLGRFEEFQDATQAILVNRREHVLPFRRAFQHFWYRRLTHHEKGMDPRVSEPASLRLASRSGTPHLESGDAIPPGEDMQPIPDRAATYSVQEVLRHKDFGQLSEEERVEVRRMLLIQDWQMPLRSTRRTIVGQRGRSLDMRAILRGSLRHGGQPVSLRFRRRRHRLRPLVVLCDVSGSMERYTRILLQFLYVLSSRRSQPIEAFVFGTRLTRLTRQLQNRNVDQALADAASVIQDWGGGTRIGQALKEFNYRWARQVLSQGAYVLIISDGFDRGEISLLAHETARLQRSCRRLIWLNPLLGDPDYRPLVRGMQAALPFLDNFLPVHNLASLEQLNHLLVSTRHETSTNSYRTLAS